MSQKTGTISFDRLRQLSSTINSAEDLNSLLNLIMSSAQELLDCMGTSLLLVDEKNNTLKFHIVLGDNNSEIMHESFPIGTGIAGKVAETGEVIISNKASDDSRIYQKVDEITNVHTETLICVPMKVRDKIVGVLEGINSNRGHFNESDQSILDFLANEAAIAVHNRLLFTRLNKANNELNSRVKELKYLYDLSVITQKQPDIFSLLDTILNDISTVLNVTSSILYLYDKNKNILVGICQSGDSENVQPSIPINEGVEGYVFQNKEAVIFPETSDHQSNFTFPNGYSTFLSVPIIVDGNCVGILKMMEKNDNTQFTSSDLQVVSNVASYIAKAYQSFQLKEEIIKQHRLKKEIEIATVLQNSFLPKNIPTIKDLDIGIYNEFGDQAEISGNFYDFIKVDEHKLAVAVCFVNGRGVPAALSMALFKNMLRGQIRRNAYPKNVFNKLNEQLCKDSTSEMGIQALYILFDTHNKVFIYSACGTDIQFNHYMIENRNFDIQKKQAQALGMNLNIDYTEYMSKYNEGDLFLAWSKDKDTPSTLSQELDNVIWNSKDKPVKEIHDMFSDYLKREKDSYHIGTLLFIKSKPKK